MTADLIPGVSGGTIAFITGIYEKFLEALGSVNKETLGLIIKFRIAEALRKFIPSFFLLFLQGSLRRFFIRKIDALLPNNHPIHTWSLFWD